MQYGSVQTPANAPMNIPTGATAVTQTLGDNTTKVATTAFVAAAAGTSTKANNLVGGNGTTLLGAVPYQSGTDTTLFAVNTTTTKKFLSQTGDGTNGAVPSWSTVTKSDVGLSAVENTAISTWAGSSNITAIGTLTALDINADVMRLRTPRTISAGATTGNVGDICWDQNYIYICVIENSWQRWQCNPWPL